MLSRFKLSKENIWQYLLIGLLFLCLALLTILRPLSQDEGVFSTISQGFKHGLLPYRDFFDHKTPAIYVCFSFFYHLFENNILYYKILFLFFYAIFCLLIARTAKQFGASPFWAITFFLTLSIIFEGEYMLAEPFVAFFLLTSVNLILKKSHIRQVFIAGLAAGVSLLFKQSAIASIFVLIIYFIINKKYRKELYLFVSGLLLPIVTLVLYFFATSTYTDALNQILIYNLRFYPKDDVLKLIRLLGPKFIETAPIWILAITFLCIFFKSKKYHRPLLLLIGLILLPAPLFFIRHYPHYWLQIVPFLAILSSLYLNSVLNDKVHTNKFLASLGTGLIIYILTLSLAKTFHTLAYTYPRYLSEKELVTLLRSKTNDASNIYVENQFVPLYFLLDKKPITKFLYITEINDWSEGAEDKVLDQVKICHPIIIWPTDSNQAYAQKLQQYILNNYRPFYWESKLGVVVYEKRDK